MFNHNRYYDLFGVKYMEQWDTYISNFIDFGVNQYGDCIYEDVPTTLDKADTLAVRATILVTFRFLKSLQLISRPVAPFNNMF